jgi:hypothetical protein
MAVFCQIQLILVLLHLLYAHVLLWLSLNILTPVLPILAGCQ